MTYPAATRARRIDCGVCPVCEDPGKPVAARSGATHDLAGLLCVEHLLAVLGMPVQTPRPAFAAPDPSAVRAAFRATLRGHSEANASPTPITLARQAPPTPLEPEALAAAMLTMRELGAVPLRTEPTYGVPSGWGCPWKPRDDDTPPRDYHPGQATAWASGADGYEDFRRGEPGLPVDVDDEAVPSGARTLAKAALKAGWKVRIMAGPERVILATEKGSLLFVARYERGKRYSSGWLRNGQGEPVSCTTKQATAILKGA